MTWEIWGLNKWNSFRNRGQIRVMDGGEANGMRNENLLFNIVNYIVDMN